MKNCTPKPFLLAALLIIAFCGFAFIPKEKNDDSKDLAGIWEMFLNQKPTGFFKILANDGTLTNIAPTQNGFVVTLTGTYTVTSDSTYMEQIEKSYNKFLNGTNNNITYKMDNKNMLTISFFINGRPYKETYRRVPFAIGL